MNNEDLLRLSRYQVLETINEEHEVFLVKNIDADKKYVKKILYTYNKSVYEYLKVHPVEGIPKIYEAIEDGDALIIIEEYIEGNTLLSEIEKNGSIHPALVTYYILQLCIILSQLHSANPPIIHRDIKPSNIIIGANYKIFLLDLNAARHHTAEKSEDTRLLGTHGFAAPEQYGFGESDERSDIYSLGILMNNMLTGVVSHEPVQDSPLTKVIEKCIQMEPDNRFQSAMELYSAIKYGMEEIKTGNNAMPYSGADTKEMEQTSLKKFLPPGFRSLKPVNMLASTIVYCFVYGAVLRIKLPSERYSEQEIVFSQFLLFIYFTIVFLFTGNYLGVQNAIIPSFIRKYKILRALAVIFVDILLFFLVLFIVALFT